VRGKERDRDRDRETRGKRKGNASKEGSTSVKAHPVAAIPAETQGMAQAGKLPTEGCEATRPANKAETRTTSFIVEDTETIEGSRLRGIRYRAIEE
jgi:hypothetical protein